MSLDLYAREVSQELSRLDGTKTLEPSAFDGFLRGTSIFAMKGLAKTARAIDMAGAPIAMAADAFTGGTEAQDRYFKEHDEVLNSAVDFWTPKPLEVGVAAEIAGGLIGQLPTIIASPHLAVGAQVLDTAEDLARQNVPAGKAVAAGVAQGAGLATGIWMPILGQNAFQRMVIGGAGFNMLQGGLTRGITGMILEGTPAAEEFKAFDGKALTLDALLGFAFGGVAHLSPAQRAHGTEAMERIKTWAQNLSPSEVAALATLRTAQHLNEDSAPGKLVDPKDVEAHVNRMRTAIDQLAKDQPVEVSDLPEASADADPARFVRAARQLGVLEKVAERVRKDEDLPDLRRAEIEKFLEDQRVAKGEAEVQRAAKETVSKVDAEGVPGFLRSAEDLIALRDDKESKDLEPIVQQAVDIAKKPGFERTAEEKILLDSILGGHLRDFLQPRSKKEENTLGAAVSDALKSLKKTEAPAGQPRGAEPPPPRGLSEGKPAGAEAIDPHFAEAMRIADEHPDLKVRTGVDANGEPTSVTAKAFVEEAAGAAIKIREQAKLLAIAAQCMLGVQ